MRDGKGYLLPANVQPEGLLCLKIWIPDDPTGYYLAAMSGAYSDMSRWTQWEKDGTNRASLAAATWKDAVDFTYENGWLNCGDMDCCDEINDKLDIILSRLQGFEDMNINVNCGGCGCGCGCKNGNGGVNDDGTPINQPLPPPPSNLEPDEPVDPWLCDAANQFLDGWIDFYNNYFILANLSTATIAAVISIAIATTIMTGGLGLVLVLLSGTLLGGAATFSDWVRDWLAENRDGLICAMVSAATPAGAYNNVVAYLLAHKADQNGTLAGEWVENILKPGFQDTDWNLLFTPDSFEIDASNVGSSCPCEGSLVFDIFSDQTWYLVPAIEGEEFVNNDATYEVGNFLWSFIGTGGNQHAQSYPDFPEFLASGKTWLGGGGGQVAETGEHAGYVMQRVGGDTNVQTFDISGASIIGVDGTNFPLSDAWTEWNANSDLPKVDFQSGLEAIFDGLDISHEADQTFTNLDQHRMTMRGLDEDPRTVQFRVYAVIAATALNLT
jgi:hypothetical protein